MTQLPRIRKKAVPAATPPKVAQAFQSPALALESAEPPRATRWMLYSLSAFFIAAIVWASLARIDEIIAAHGELVSTVPTLVVQPLELSMVKHIDVKAGQVVKKGQELAALDPTFTQADVDQLSDKVQGLKARKARLTAELDGTDYALPPDPNEAQRLEAALFAQRKKNLADHVRGYEQDLARVQATLKSTEADIAAAKSRIAVLQDIVDTRQTLSNKALGSRLSMLDAQAQLLAAQRDLDKSKGDIAPLTHQAQSITAQLDAFTEDWRVKASDELITVQRDLNSTQEDLNKALKRRAMTNLTAPRDAVVLDVAKRSTGSVLQGGETLFTLVPLDAPLQVEVRVLPMDVGHIKVGDDVRVKLDAYPFQKYGALKGVIETISPDTFTTGTDNRAQNAVAGNRVSYYKAVVKLKETKLPNPPDNFRLLPGMTATADIDVGTRTVISYLLYPILGSLDTSIREP